MVSVLVFDNGVCVCRFEGVVVVCVCNCALVLQWD